MDGLELGTSSSVVHPLQGGTESNLHETRKSSKGGTYKAVDSPYHSLNHQLGEDKKTLARQQEEAAYKLAGVHRYYEGLLAQHETERPSAPDG
jgi:hypothetical protein